MPYLQDTAPLFTDDELNRSAFHFAAVLFGRPMILTLGIVTGVTCWVAWLFWVSQNAPLYVAFCRQLDSYTRLGCDSSAFTMPDYGRDQSLPRSKEQRLYIPAVKRKFLSIKQVSNQSSCNRIILYSILLKSRSPFFHKRQIL